MCIEEERTPNRTCGMADFSIDELDGVMKDATSLKQCHLLSLFLIVQSSLVVPLKSSNGYVVAVSSFY